MTSKAKRKFNKTALVKKSHVRGPFFKITVSMCLKTAFYTKYLLFVHSGPDRTIMHMQTPTRIYSKSQLQRLILNNGTYIDYNNLHARGR